MDQATSRLMIYFFTFVILAVGVVATQYGYFDWPHSSFAHSLMQSGATVIGFFCGAAALYRYYKGGVKSSMLFYIGVAFLATTVIDTYHTIVTTAWFGESFPDFPKVILRWSWLETRLFLAVLLLLSLVGALTGKDDQSPNEKLVYGVLGFLTLFSLFFFVLVPLPFPMYPEDIISRPLEFLPAGIFFITMIGYLMKGKWKTVSLENWMVLCLIASVMSQVYMALSKELFDPQYHMAHVVKIISYAMVYIGITA